MRDFQEPSRWRAIFASRAVLSILLLLLLGMGVMSFRALEAGWSAEAERAAVTEHVQELEEKKSALTSELEELRSQEGVEREARQRLNFRKQGEEIIIIRDTNGDQPREEVTKAGLFSRLLQWIGIP
ncbi:MAG: hypothetical protein A2719_00740 [Candidatus Ryanbacteria bacterium RIFCSPHIGHO2_01_FULL_45_22]|uniref:Septum formation initiator n=1 Tax=Candidatus Ryanbacteria bacterium RIFCSPHIGHO2_01_FULL_45_22 TaxID=1802114 RepID=A0A1G2G040_9BACT|nr:MAG: hypothetical protein A2719_00740 [Candidatus Ryanbacteria bacterium RIFCSPHIGHO2_01_FULL_45_22]